MRNENRRGYGNDAPMEIPKRFPQELGNLAREREIPTFPQPIISVSQEEAEEEDDEEGNDMRDARQLELDTRPPVKAR